MVLVSDSRAPGEPTQRQRVRPDVPDSNQRPGLLQRQLHLEEVLDQHLQEADTGQSVSRPEEVRPCRCAQP